MDLEGLQDAQEGPSIFSPSPGFDSWLEANAPLLAETDLPTFLIPALHHKVSNAIYDLGSHVGLAEDDDEPKGCRLSAVALAQMSRESDVFLVDHCWTFADPVEARMQLEAMPALRERIEGLLEMDPLEPNVIADTKMFAARLDEITARLWILAGSYEDETGTKAYFVLDELGTRLVPPVDASVTATFCHAIIIDATSGEAYSIIWPQRDVAEGEVVTCARLPNGRMRLNRLRSSLWGFEVDTQEDDTEVEEEADAMDDGAKTAHPHPEHTKLPVGLIPVPPSPAPSSEHHLRVHHTSSLCARFISLGYTSPSIATLFGAPVGYGVTAESLCNPVTRGETDAKLAALANPSNIELVTLARFFLVGSPLPRSLLGRALTPELLAFCEDQNMLFSRDDPATDPLYYPLIQFHPVSLPPPTLPVPTSPIPPTNLVLATDFPHTTSLSLGAAFDPVMHLGVDSLALVGSLASSLLSSLISLTQRASSTVHPLSILDLCTGSGVQGIAAAALLRSIAISAGHAGSQQPETTLVDINPRACRFASFNSALNGTHAAVMVGTLYEPLGTGKMFDLVLANPPYIPNPGKVAKLEAYGDGGEGGEEVMAAVFSGFGRRLAEGGVTGVVGNLVNPSEYSSKVHRWVGKDLGLRGTLKYGRVWGVEEYAKLIVGVEAPEYARALRLSGVKGVANGVFIGMREGGEVDVAVEKGADQLWYELNLVATT
ncbi:hypothetical protein HDU93_007615 [Gonapodya sp. JEL0774]|nr:hypothetical protein HDU93_007615 [Gonapodya sp. JEL0774]